MPGTSDVVDRVRAALAAHDPVREVRMFGGVSFMVDGKMVVSARGDGELLVRADPARSEELLAVAGARQAEMGAGRTMGRTWISVSVEAVATDEALEFWLGVAIEHHRSAGAVAGSRGASAADGPGSVPA